MLRVGVLVVVALCACAAEEERAEWFDATKYRYQPTREAIERGVKSGDFVQCDIREEACQVKLFGATEKAYGTDASRPPTSIVSPEEFDEYSQGMLTPDQAAQSDAYSTELFQALWLLGMLSPELSPDNVSVGSVGRILAAYFFIPKEVLVIDWHMDMDDPESVLTLSHEYVHALQDDEYDLTKLHEGVAHTKLHDEITTVDAKHGLLGLVEGEAEVYATLVATGYLTEDPAEWRDQRRDLLFAALSDPAPFLVASVYFPYWIGNEFATFTWLNGGNQGLADRYAAVPKSSREVLAGVDADTPKGGWVETVDGTSDGRLPAGFDVVLDDSFGAWILHVFLEQLVVWEDGEVERTEKERLRLPGESVATDLRGDRVVSFGSGNARVVVWRMRFEPKVSPADVIAEIEDTAPGRFLMRVENGDLLLFASDSTDVLEEFAADFALP